MGYFDIIKRGFNAANRNLMVLLTQFAQWFVIVACLLVLVAGLMFAAAGSLPSLDIENISVERIESIIAASISLIAAIVVVGGLFLLLAGMLAAFVHSGNLGCIIRTVSGEAKGFTAAEFFSSGRRSLFPMFWLFILWVLISIGVVLLFALVAGVGFGGVLMPLKESGRNLTAFGVGVPFIIILILAGILALFFFYAGWTFSSIILVGERRGAASSISGAVSFIAGNFWDTLLFSLLILALYFAANLLTNVFSLPFNMASESSTQLAISLFPLLLISIILQMYVGLVALSCFCAFYVSRTSPPQAQEQEAPAGPDDTQDAEMLEAEVIEPEGSPVEPPEISAEEPNDGPSPRP